MELGTERKPLRGKRAAVMVRICTKRDAPCPHGVGCPYVDGYNCTEPDTHKPQDTDVEALAARIASLQAELSRVRAERDRAMKACERIAANAEAALARMKEGLAGMVVVGEAYLPYDAPNGPCNKRLEAARALLAEDGR